MVNLLFNRDMSTDKCSPGGICPSRNLLQSVLAVRWTFQLGARSLSGHETYNGVGGRWKTQQDRQESVDCQQPRELRRRYSHGQWTHQTENSRREWPMVCLNYNTVLLYLWLNKHVELHRWNFPAQNNVNKKHVECLTCRSIRNAALHVIWCWWQTNHNFSGALVKH